MISNVYELMKQGGSREVNVMTLDGYDNLTISYTATGSDIAGSVAVVNNGNQADVWMNRNSANSSVDNYVSYTATFASPITVTKIVVKYGGYGRERTGDCGSGPGSAWQTTKVNNVQVAALNGPGNVSSVSDPLTDTTIRTGVTEVLLNLYAHSDACANLNPREATSYIYELEIWAMV